MLDGQQLTHVSTCIVYFNLCNPKQYRIYIFLFIHIYMRDREREQYNTDHNQTTRGKSGELILIPQNKQKETN